MRNFRRINPVFRDGRPCPLPFPARQISAQRQPRRVVAASGVIFRRIEPDALVPGIHQLRDGFTREHVDLEFAAVQLAPEMLAQRLLLDAKLLGDVGDAKSRGALDEGALVCGRHIFGWHFL